MDTTRALLLFDERKREVLDDAVKSHYGVTSHLPVFMDGRLGVDLRQETCHRELLVLGTGRCGTTYLSALLMDAGMDVPHLHVGAFGTVSHYFMTDHFWYPAPIYAPDDMAHVGERKGNYVFNKIVHLVRAPLQTITSLSIWQSKTDLLYLVESGVVPHGVLPSNESEYWIGMVVYYYVNKFILEHNEGAYLLRLESIRDQWSELVSFLGIAPVSMPNTPPKNQSGTPIISEEEILVRKHFGEVAFLHNIGNTLPVLTKEGMFGVDKDLAQSILELGKRMGYDE